MKAFSSSEKASDRIGVAQRRLKLPLPSRGTYIVSAMIVVLGVFLIYPVLLILTLSFNTSEQFFFGARTWGLDNWRSAFAEPGLFRALWNTVWL